MKTLLIVVLGSLVAGGYIGQLLLSDSKQNSVDDDVSAYITPDPSDFLSMRPAIDALDVQELSVEERGRSHSHA